MSLFRLRSSLTEKEKLSLNTQNQALAIFFDFIASPPPLTFFFTPPLPLQLTLFFLLHFFSLKKTAFIFIFFLFRLNLFFISHYSFFSLLNVVEIKSKFIGILLIIKIK